MIKMSSNIAFVWFNLKKNAFLLIFQNAVTHKYLIFPLETSEENPRHLHKKWVGTSVRRCNESWKSANFESAWTTWWRGHPVITQHQVALHTDLSLKWWTHAQLDDIISAPQIFPLFLNVRTALAFFRFGNSTLHSKRHKALPKNLFLWFKTCF